MNEYPHGTTLIFKTQKPAEVSPTLTEEIGVKMVFVSGDAEMIAAVYPKPVIVAHETDGFLTFGAVEADMPNIDAHSPIPLTDDFEIVANRLYAFQNDWLKTRLPHVFEAVKNTVDPAEISQYAHAEFEKARADFKRRNDAIARATSEKSIPQRAADAVGVTPYSDCRQFVEQAVQWALDNDDRKYTIGDETMKRVFEPNGMVNLADLQAFLDAVEQALTSIVSARPEVPNAHKVISNAEVNDLTLEHIGKWPSFDAQWWAGAVVNVVLNYLVTTGRIVKPEPSVPLTISPIAEPEPVAHENIANLHEQAVEAHLKAELHAQSLYSIPENLVTKSDAIEIMVSEYFELARIAADLSEKTGMKFEDMPEGENVWRERSMWHHRIKNRHGAIKAYLTGE